MKLAKRNLNRISSRSILRYSCKHNFFTKYDFSCSCMAQMKRPMLIHSFACDLRNHFGWHDRLQSHFRLIFPVLLTREAKLFNSNGKPQLATVRLVQFLWHSCWSTIKRFKLSYRVLHWRRLNKCCTFTHYRWMVIHLHASPLIRRRHCCFANAVWNTAIEAKLFVFFKIAAKRLSSSFSYSRAKIRQHFETSKKPKGIIFVLRPREWFLANLYSKMSLRNFSTTSTSKIDCLSNQKVLPVPPSPFHSPM